MTREKKLIRKIEYGDRSALEELIEIYYADILNYCQWHTKEQTYAEDATQETFLKAMRYLGSNHFQGEFRPFLYKIARNTCIDLMRKGFQTDICMENLKQEPAYTEMGFRQAEEAIWMDQIVSKQDSDVQEILLLRFGEEMSLKEIAAVTGLPMRTVQSKLRAALKRLKREWKYLEDQKGKGGEDW